MLTLDPDSNRQFIIIRNHQGELTYYDWFVHDPDIDEHIYAGTYLPHETEHLPANRIQPYLPVYTD